MRGLVMFKVAVLPTASIVDRWNVPNFNDGN